MLIPMRTRTERTTDQATLTERAVLGLLTLGERSGYDLLKTIEQSVGFFWTPAKSQLYALLPRLVVRGLLKARRVEQDKRPAKTLYRITPAGRGALRKGLEQASPAVDRNPFELRIYLPERPAAALESLRAARILEDSVQRDELRYDDVAHLCLLVACRQLRRLGAIALIGA